MQKYTFDTELLYHYECYPNNNNNVGTLIGITSRLDFFSPICLLSFQCWAAFEVSLGDEGWQSLCNSLSNAIYYLLLEPLLAWLASRTAWESLSLVSILIWTWYGFTSFSLWKKSFKNLNEFEQNTHNFCEKLTISKFM